MSDKKTVTVDVNGMTYLMEVKGLPGERLFSADGGQSWHPVISEALKFAREKGNLVVSSEPLTEGGEFEGFLLELTKKISALKVGERISIVRTYDSAVVLKESALMAVKFSTISEANLGPEED